MYYLTGVNVDYWNRGTSHSNPYYFPLQAYEFLLFAGLMALDMLVFMCLAMSYQYVTHHDTEEEDGTMAHQSTATLGSTVTHED